MFNTRTLVSIIRRRKVITKVEAILFFVAFFDILLFDIDGRHRFFETVSKFRASCELSGKRVEFLFSSRDTDTIGIFIAWRVRDPTPFVVVQSSGITGGVCHGG